MQEQSFLQDEVQTYGWPKWKNFTYKALFVALKKKKLKTFYHFPTLYLHFPDFFQV